MMLQITCRSIALAVLGMSMIAVLPAVGQVIQEDIKVVADDGAANDWFGRSVAISGTSVIVGMVFVVMRGVTRARGMYSWVVRRI